MKQLLEDYERRLVSIQKMIDELPSKNCPTNPDHIRLTTKRSCYRTVITEIERELNKVGK